MSNRNLSGGQFGPEQVRRMYHLTDNPNFEPDPDFVPQDNTIAIRERNDSGLYLANDVESWVNGQGYMRPYVAEVDVPEGVGRAERWGGEHFVPAADLGKTKVSRVVPIDAHVREQFGEYGWTEQALGTTFDTEEPIEYHRPEGAITERPVKPVSRNYAFQGDVRQMPPEEHARFADRTARTIEWRERNR